jgi:hypothetical protein
VRKPEGTRPLGKLRCKWEDIIRMDSREMGCSEIDCLHLAQEGICGSCEHSNEHLGSK